MFVPPGQSANAANTTNTINKIGFVPPTQNVQDNSIESGHNRFAPDELQQISKTVDSNGYTAQPSSTSPGKAAVAQKSPDLVSSISNAINGYNNWYSNLQQNISGPGTVPNAIGKGVQDVGTGFLGGVNSTFGTLYGLTKGLVQPQNGESILAPLESAAKSGYNSSPWGDTSKATQNAAQAFGIDENKYPLAAGAVSGAFDALSPGGVIKGLREANSLDTLANAGIRAMNPVTQALADAAKAKMPEAPIVKTVNPIEKAANVASDTSKELENLKKIRMGTKEGTAENANLTQRINELEQETGNKVETSMATPAAEKVIGQEKTPLTEKTPSMASQEVNAETVVKPDINNAKTAEEAMASLPDNEKELQGVIDDLSKQAGTEKDQSKLLKINLQLFAAKEKMVDLKTMQYGKGTNPLAKYDYINNKELNLRNTGDMKADYRDARSQYAEDVNTQKVMGAQLGDTIDKTVKSPEQRAALQFYLDYGKDAEAIKLDLAMYRHKASFDELIPGSKTMTYRQAMEAATKLSPEEKAAADKLAQYYTENGEYSKGLGSIGNIKENYAARIWDTGTDTKTTAGKSNPNGDMGTFNRHGLERKYNTIAEGIADGKRPVTLDASKLMQIHNEESAIANSNRKFANALQSSGLGGYVNGSVPEGFTKVESFKREMPYVDAEGKAQILKRTFVVPDKLAYGLKAIMQRNGTKGVDLLRGLQKYQGVVKTYDLAWSAFHHINLTKELLYNNRLGYDFIKHFDTFKKVMTSPEFRDTMEKDAVSHGLITSKVESNQDIIRSLTGKDNFLNNFINKGWNSDNKAIKTIAAPFKGATWLADKNSKFLFGTMQRYFKVLDYGVKAADYLGRHPQATGDMLKTAKRGIADEVNAAYGGLNWQRLGMSSSNVSLMRLALLAPDWVTSNIAMAGKAFVKDAGGQAARRYWLTTFVAGGLATEFLNKIVTGHYTDQNPKGHEFDIQLAPGVYTSMFPGTAKDALRMMSLIEEKGGPGVFQFAQGKLSPVARATIGALSGTNYYGGSVYGKGSFGKNTGSLAQFLAANLLPVPFGGSAAVNYAKGGNANAAAGVAVGLGAAAYQKPSSSNNPQAASQGNIIQRTENLFNPEQRAKQSIIDKIDQQSKTQAANDKTARTGIEQALRTNKPGTIPSIMKKYNIPPSKRSEMVKSVRDSIKLKGKSALAQKYLGMSQQNKTKFKQSLSADELKTLQSEINK